MGVGEEGAGGLPTDGTLSDTAWLARAGGLTVEATDDHETTRAPAAESRALRLRAAAQALCAVTPQPFSDPTASAVARRLAAGAAPDRPDPAAGPGGGHGPDGPAPDRDPRALAAGFVGALSDASVAVYFCRCTQHPGGRCWFSAAGPDDGLCGDVLALAHRLAPRTRAS